MPTRWVIQGLSEVVDINNCALTEMQLVGRREDIKIPRTSTRDEAIKMLKEARLVWEEETPLEVLAKIEEVRRHYLGDTIPTKRKRGAGLILLLLFLKRILNRRITIIWR